MNYLATIKIAIFTFPIIAILFTIPFILHQYHKYSSINKWRVLIIYSFILYMLTIYFLVILPLPNPKDVTFKENMIRLIPFSFINDLIKESSFVLTDPKTYIKALKEPCFYTVILNIFMTIPFGMYLRYYFKCNLKKTIKYSFTLSLFFELTQLTRLYFIYPYQYRVFDIDDLITNTLGGILGYYIMGLIAKFLPSRDEIDERSREQGTKVSGLRRITLHILDLFIYLILTINISIITKTNHPFILTFILYYIIIPTIYHNQTLGGKFLNVQLEYQKSIIRNILRLIFLYLYYIVIPLLLIQGSITLTNLLHMTPKEAILTHLLFLCIIIIHLLSNLFHLIRHNHIYYDKLFKITFKSTIQTKETKAE